MVNIAITTDVTFQRTEDDTPEQLSYVHLYMVDSTAKKVADEIYRQLGLLPSLEPSSSASLVDARTVTNS